MSHFTNLTMPEEHENRFRRWFGWDENSVLPHNVINDYWAAKRLYDQTGDPMPTSELVRIAQNSGYVPDPPADTFLDIILDGQVGHDSVLMVEFRKQWQTALFKGVDEDKILAQIIDSPEERKFSPESVRWPTVAEIRAYDAELEQRRVQSDANKEAAAGSI